MSTGEVRESRHERRLRISELLRERIRARVHLGLLRPGDRLASARELADQLEVTPRAIMAAYAELERQGLVERRQREGVFLTPDGAPGGRLSESAEWLVELLLQGLARGIPVPDLSERLRQATVGRRLHAVCVECNDDHLHALCTELAGDYGFRTTPMPLQVPLARSPDPHALDELRAADLVVTTSFHAREVERAAARAGRPSCSVTLNPELGSELIRQLQRAPVYVVAADPRFVHKLRASLAWNKHGHELRACILGRDDPDAIPPGSTVYVTAKARERFTAGPQLNVLFEGRVFALESARDLLRHLVTANTRATETPA